MILHYWVIISKPYKNLFSLAASFCFWWMNYLSVYWRFVDIKENYFHKGVLYCYLFPCREVKNANADMRAKIQKLVEVGLLGFAHWSSVINVIHVMIEWTFGKKKMKL